MAGPVIFPYNVYPVTADRPADLVRRAAGLGQTRVRTRSAGSSHELGDYAGQRGVTVGIEPVDHWEQAAPNLVGDVLISSKGSRRGRRGLYRQRARRAGQRRARGVPPPGAPTRS